MVSGIISALLGLYVAVKLKFVSEYPHLGLKFFKYLAWLFREIVISTIEVLRVIWSIKPLTESHFEKVSTKQTTAMGYTLLGNSITLTPGTVCVRVDDNDGRIMVHALNNKGMSSLHEGNMDRKVLEAVK